MPTGVQHPQSPIRIQPALCTLCLLSQVNTDLSSMAALSNELWVLSLNDLAKYAAAKDHSLRIVIAGSSQDPKQGDTPYENEVAVL